MPEKIKGQPIRIRITRNYRFADCVDTWALAGQDVYGILLPGPTGRVYAPTFETMAGRKFVVSFPADVWEEIPSTAEAIDGVRARLAAEGYEIDETTNDEEVARRLRVLGYDSELTAEEKAAVIEAEADTINDGA